MRRVPVGRTLLIAACCALIPLIGNVVASFVSTRTGGATWLVVPVVGVGVAMVTALIQAYGSAEAKAARPSTQPPSPTPYGHAPPYRHYGRSTQGGTPLVLALVIGLLVLGVGGLAVTQAVRFGVGYITGNEPGADRLVRPATGSAYGLTMTLENVWHTRHFTRVHVATKNRSGSSLSIPLGFCRFIGADGTTLQADEFRSDWSTELPNGAFQRGTMTFTKHIPDSVKLASLNCRIFGLLVREPTITVSDIRLKPS